MEGLRSIHKNKISPQNQPFSALQTTIISCLKLPGRDTIPIQSAAKVPRLGTIGKNHIQSSLSLYKLFFFDCSESDTFLKNYTTYHQNFLLFFPILLLIFSILLLDSKDIF